MEKIRIDLGENSYDIKFSDNFFGLSEDIKNRKALIVTDTNVNKLYAKEIQTVLRDSGCETAVYAFQAGEENKNMESILGICKACIDNKLDRRSLIVALGGGVAGDMAGFAASIYMRGIDFIQIPTTLLSQSDSSVGGKTGIDFMESKNILGAFHQPKLVYINVSTLKTLPKKQIVSGMGEVIKHGIIMDREFFYYIKNNAEKIKSLDSEFLIGLTKRNCEIKADVVMQDEKENGLRTILNFGHTIGHAIESAFDFKMTHGECVGLGMIAAAYIAKEKGLIESSVLEEIEDILKLYDFRTRVSLPDRDVILSFMSKDKKKLDGKLKFILPVKIGGIKQTTDVSNEEIEKALCYINGGNIC